MGGGEPPPVSSTQCLIDDPSSCPPILSIPATSSSNTTHIFVVRTPSRYLIHDEMPKNAAPPHRETCRCAPRGSGALALGGGGLPFRVKPLTACVCETPRCFWGNETGSAHAAPQEAPTNALFAARLGRIGLHNNPTPPPFTICRGRLSVPIFSLRPGCDGGWSPRGCVRVVRGEKSPKDEPHLPVVQWRGNSRCWAQASLRGSSASIKKLV